MSAPVVGVDPSLTSTGLARIAEHGDVATHLVRTETQTTLAGTAERIRYVTGHVVRFAPRGALVLIEEMYVPRGGKAAGSVLERAWLWGFIVDQLLRRDCDVVTVTAKQRAKLATGSGNADKAAVLAAMRARVPGASIPDHNVADALALAAAGAHWLGYTPETFSEKQNEAMTAVAWPTRGEDR